MKNFKNKLLNIANSNTERVAIRHLDTSVTYGDLLSNSQSIINAIKIFPLVGLYFEKSINYLQSVFAVTLAKDTGFLPLDITSPKERLEYIAKDSNLEIVITSKNYSNSTLQKIPEHLTVLYIEDLLDKTEFNTDLSIDHNELSYVIYTSGSTGNPKGVELSYNGLDNVISQQIDIFKMDKSNFYLYLAISFDASLSDIYCSFLSGSTIHINDELRKDIISLKKYFNKYKITHSDLPPSILKLVKPEDFKTLKNIVIGGEVADYASVQNFASKMNIINVYGPTEATICTSYCYCDENWNKPLIGNPLNNVFYKVVDENKNLINEKNKIGELIIGGCQLALGYLNNDKLNSNKFIKFENEDFYLSGDLVQYNDNNELEFIGRVDRQIKYHGQLICLEEIESAINSIPEVKSVSVVLKNDKIYAYFEGDINSSEIKKSLVDKIPKYMIPSFIINQELPKTVTGKNDSKKLASDKSQTGEIQALINLFKEVLSHSNVNIDELEINEDTKFVDDLCADSIDFITLHLELAQMGINMEYDYLVENNSIKDILNYGTQNKKITTGLLVEECSKLDIPNNIKRVEKIKPKKVLITGATGFLGSTLIRDLISSVEEVHCIVRAKNDIEAKTRLLRVLEKNSIHLTVEESSKLSVYAGDLTLNNFGLNNEKYKLLSHLIDNVYHCAAEVNNIKSFKQLFNSNVNSTVKIAKFLFDGCDKNLHYASTLSVYVSSDKLDNSILEEKYLNNDNHRLYSGYAQSKWLAEYYLNKINKISNNIFSYRFGLLTADTNTFNSPKGSFLDDCVNQLKEIKEAPIDDLNISMDITPINIATKAMVDISIHENSNIFHITTNYQLSLSTILSILKNVNLIPTEEWFIKYSGKTIVQYMTELNNIYTKQRNMNLFETTHVYYFDTNNSQKYIQSFNIEKYLNEII